RAFNLAKRNHRLQSLDGHATATGPGEPRVGLVANAVQTRAWINRRVESGAVAADASRNQQRAGQLRLPFGAGGGAVRSRRAIGNIPADRKTAAPPPRHRRSSLLRLSCSGRRSRTTTSRLTGLV